MQQKAVDDDVSCLNVPLMESISMEVTIMYKIYFMMLHILELTYLLEVNLQSGPPDSALFSQFIPCCFHLGSFQRNPQKRRNCSWSIWY